MTTFPDDLPKYVEETLKHAIKEMDEECGIADLAAMMKLKEKAQ